MAALTYKGNPLLTYRTMFFWVLPLFIFSFFLGSDQHSEIIIIVIVLMYFVLLLLNTRHTYYFILSQDKLLIRNHFMFWYKKSFLLKEINSIRIDTNPTKSSRYTNPTFLRIYTSPLDYKTFYGCTLRDRQWRTLQKELKERNIRLISFIPDFEIKFSDML